jgi:hypothetical protein
VAEQSVVVAVGSYRTIAAAQADCASLWALHRAAGSDELAAAVVHKGLGGELGIDHYQTTATEPVWGAILIGACVAVLAPPLGIAFLASHLTSRAEWAGAEVVVGRLWHRLPKDGLRTMCNLLEAGQAGLVVVGTGHDQAGVAGCLTGTTGQPLLAGLRADLAADAQLVMRPA